MLIINLIQQYEELRSKKRKEKLSRLSYYSPCSTLKLSFPFSEILLNICFNIFIKLSFFLNYSLRRLL